MKLAYDSSVVQMVDRGTARTILKSAGCAAAFIALVAMSGGEIEAAPPSGNDWVSRGLATAEDFLQTPMIGGEYGGESVVAVSGDGRQIAYSQGQMNIAQNENAISLMLMNTMNRSSTSTPQRLEEKHGASAIAPFSPQFSPDGQKLAYMSNKGSATAGSDEWAGPSKNSLAIRDLANGLVSYIELSEIPVNRIAPGFVPATFLSFAWSPNGQQLGIVVSGFTGKHEQSTGTEISANGGPPSYVDLAAARLVIYDLKTADWSVVGPAAIQIDSFDWAPNGRQLVFAGSRERQYAYLHTHIYIADLQSGESREVVSQPGVNRGPLWSPDGRWIAFHSQAGELRPLARSRIGLYDVVNASLSYPAFGDIGRISGLGVGKFIWAPDSRSLLVRIPYQLAKQFFKLSIPNGLLEYFSNDGASDFGAAQYAINGKKLFFVRESFTESPTIYVTDSRHMVPERVGPPTPVSSSLNIEARLLSWPSGDAKWTVHAWVLLPKQAKVPLPLLVYAEGGPTMISPDFRAGGWTYPLQAFVASGIAVLIPNSRGRAGYGADFEKAWETEQDPGRGPLDDDLGGVDALVQAGLVDGARVALAGHSWGGYLGAYALTHTKRFSAILIHEAVSLNMVDASFFGAVNKDIKAFARELGKEGLPFDEKEAAHLKDISPIYQVYNAKTPALIEVGANGQIQDGTALFQGLSYFNVPSELVSYPATYHVTEEPVLRVEQARRELEWFAYWVLGKPTQRMLDRYGQPRIREWDKN